VGPWGFENYIYLNICTYSFHAALLCSPSITAWIDSEHPSTWSLLHRRPRQLLNPWQAEEYLGENKNLVMPGTKAANGAPKAARPEGKPRFESAFAVIQEGGAAASDGPLLTPVI